MGCVSPELCSQVTKGQLEGGEGAWVIIDTLGDRMKRGGRSDLFRSGRSGSPSAALAVPVFVGGGE